MTRKRVPVEVLRREKKLIYQFTFDTVVPKQGAYFYIHDAYDTYKLWLAECGESETELSVDGFGRMFPGCYRRRLVGRDGRIARAVLDAELVWG